MRKATLALLLLLGLITSGQAQQSPDEFFKLSVGADRTLVKYPDIVKYFEYLAENSKRVTVSNEGASTLGNPMYLAVISSEANIKNMPRLLEINRKLANPDLLTDTEARALIGQAKVFVLITCSIHATEIAASQASMVLAHQLATTQDPAQLAVLDQVVVLLMPSINPDGNIMVTEWYQKYLGTPYEGGGMPWLYHYYAGHDDNRDYFMLNLKESQVVNAVAHQKYFPEIFLDMHQMGNTGPRLFVPPYKDPLNPNLSPVMLREGELIGAAMSLKLQENGKSGVASAYAYDAYWPGGTKNTAWYKNVVGLLTEMASVRIASPVYIDPNELRSGGKGLPEYKAQVNFPDPWPGGWWRLKDIMDYELLACQALIELAAQRRSEFIGNFLRMGQDNIARGKAQPPYAYILPKNQWDDSETYTFLQKMEMNGVRLYQLTRDWRCGSTIYDQGSYVIPMDQPYRGFIQAMMERQRYPEIRYLAGGPVIEPYDATGWTMPLQMGVKYTAIDTPLDRNLLALVKGVTYPAVKPTLSGEYLLLPARCNRSFLAVNRLDKRGIKVSRITAGSTRAGDFLIPVTSLDEAVLMDTLRDTGVPVTKTSLSATEKASEITPPRLAIYQSYNASMDEGWTRWVLDNYGFTYQVLHNADFQEKDALAKYDAIIFPSLSRMMIVEGKYAEDRPSYFSSLPKEYEGGIGSKGVENLKEFVKTGGRVVLLDAAWELGQKEFELPLTNVLKDVGRDKFWCPGSILQIQVDNTDPLAWGLEKESILYFSGGAIFATNPPAKPSIDRKVVGRFAAEGPHLLSGYLQGEGLLDNRVAIVRFQYEKGKVVVLGGRVQNRAQTFATFKFLFNALYLQ